jgi:hypothetical protein
MKVVPMYNDALDKAFNYLSLKEKMFYFNNYKTAGTYKTQSIPVCEEIFQLLKNYRKKGLLLQNKEKPLTSPQLTVILNKIFGKRRSTSMLSNMFF